MNAQQLIRSARTDAGLTLRQLAMRAGTSHSTLAAYESGRTVPTVETLRRIVEAAGWAIDVTLRPRAGRHHPSREGRGDELVQVLELAEQFPARHAATSSFPVFGAA